MPSPDLIVVGAGVFGVTAAIELRRRGYDTMLIDPGPIPNPLAASTDISKVIRMEYGADEQYMEMVEACLPLWRSWNDEFGYTLFHETGVTMVTHDRMEPGGFEYESFHTLRKRGHTPERLDEVLVSDLFPAWKPSTFKDGFYHRKGGFAESGRVIHTLVEKAVAMGVEVKSDTRVTRLVVKGNRVVGVETGAGNILSCERVVVAAGVWTSRLVPELSGVVRISGHPVFHLQPGDPAPFQQDRFSTFMADTALTGWYGFPLHPHERVVKVANHGVGQMLGPDDERVVSNADVKSMRQFLSTSFPLLVHAPIVYTRRCLYCDTLDNHFWIDNHPHTNGLTVATGGSGHGFKFAPILGPLIADALDGKPNKWLPRFAWRPLDQRTRGEEASRLQG